MEKKTHGQAAQEPPNLQQRNIDAIAKVESAVMGERSAGERFARFVIRRIGTPTSVCIHIAPELLAELTPDTDPATIGETIKTTMPAEE